MADPTNNNENLPKITELSKEDFDKIIQKYKEYTTQLGDTNEVLKKQLELKQKLAFENRASLEEINIELQTLQDLFKKAKDANEQTKIELEIKEKEIEQLKAIKRERTSLIDSLNKEKESIEANLKAAQELGDPELINEYTKKHEEVTTNITESQKKLLEISEEVKKQNDELEKQRKAVQKIKELEEERKSIGNILLKALKDQVQQFTTISGLTSLIIDYAKEVLSVEQRIAATTGDISLANKMINADLLAQGSLIGANGSKLTETYLTLRDTVASFSDLEESNASLANEVNILTTGLTNMGVSAATSGKNINVLQKTFNMGLLEAAKTNQFLVRSALGAGITAKKMTEDFASALSMIAVYGKDGIKVFVDLEKQAKALGVELGTLTKVIGDQFDTFEGATRAAAGFNAVLGGNYLDGIEMMNLKENERLVLLKQSFERTGLVFSQLDKWTQKTVAARLGITNLSEANQLFNDTTANMISKMNESAISTEKLQKAQEDAAKITDKLKASFYELFVALKPIMETLISFINGFMSLNKALGGSLIPILGIIVAFKSFGAIIAFLFGPIKSLIAFKRLLGTESFLNAIKITLFGEANKKAAIDNQIASNMNNVSAANSARAMAAFGAAVAGIGVGIGAAAYGIGQLAAGFKGLEAAQINAVNNALIGFTAVFVALIATVALLAATGALEAAELGLLGFGGAVALIGLGVALAAAGIAYMASQIALIGKDSVTAIGPITGLTLAIGGLVLVVGLLGLALVKGGWIAVAAIGAGLVLLAGSVFILSSAMYYLSKSIDKEGMKAASDTLGFLLRIPEIKVSTLNDVAKGIKAIAKELKELPENQTFNFNATLNLMSNVNKISSINESTVSAFKQVKQIILDLFNGFKTMPVENINRFNALLNTMNANLSSFSGVSASAINSYLNSIGQATASIASIPLDPIKQFNTILEKIIANLDKFTVKLTNNFVSTINSITALFNSIGTASEAKINLVAPMIGGINANIKDFPVEKSVALRATLTPLNETLRLSTGTSKASLEPATNFIATVKQYYEAQKDSKDENKDALVSALKEVMKLSTGGAAGGNQQPIQIILNVDGSRILNVMKKDGKAIDLF